MPEQLPPYGPSTTSPPRLRRRTRIHHLQEMKDRGQKWAMLTAYDMYSAAIFDEAEIPVLLVGDSASNNVLGHESTLPVTVDELLPLARAVSRHAPHALIIADLPFGSYEESPEQCLRTAVRFVKESGVQAVKIEGTREMVPQVKKLSSCGIPVMAHIGFTPQHEHALGGYRVQGKGESSIAVLDAAESFADAGAFSLLLEMIPAQLAAEITDLVSIPTVGIGAGMDCDAQVLVWQDMTGLRTGKVPRFVKQYANLHDTILTAAQEFSAEVSAGAFPTTNHCF